MKLRFRVRYWVVSNKVSFSFNLAEKNSLIRENGINSLRNGQLQHPQWKQTCFKRCSTFVFTLEVPGSAYVSLRSRRSENRTRRKRNCAGGSAKNKKQREGVRRTKDSFSPHPLPVPPHPLPTSPQFFAQPRRAPSLARFFARLLDLRLEKERKRLLRRLHSYS